MMRVFHKRTPWVKGTEDLVRGIRVRIDPRTFEAFSFWGGPDHQESYNMGGDRETNIKIFTERVGVALKAKFPNASVEVVFCQGTAAPWWFVTADPGEMPNWAIRDRVELVCNMVTQDIMIENGAAIRVDGVFCHVLRPGEWPGRRSCDTNGVRVLPEGSELWGPAQRKWYGLPRNPAA